MTYDIMKLAMGPWPMAHGGHDAMAAMALPLPSIWPRL